MRLRHHLGHWLVPHKHNDHRPRLIRWYGLTVVAVAIIAIQGLAIVTMPATAKVSAPHGLVLAYASDINPVDLLTQTNQQRAAAGLAPLRMDARLNTSAQLKAQNMFAEDYWAHVSPSGIQPWYWFTQAGYQYVYAGENLAKDFDTTSGVMSGWMNSAGHRANILNANYTDVGFAVENGTLVGGQTTLVVAHYGHEAGTAVAAAKPAAPKTTTPAKAAAPVATPVPTPVATPAPTPTPIATPTPTPVTPSGQVSEAAPVAQNYSLLRPLAVTRTLPWPKLATIGLLSLLLAVYAATHLAVWRRGLRRWRHRGYRRLAYAQLGGLAAIILLIASSGFGRVG